MENGMEWNVLGWKGQERTGQEEWTELLNAMNKMEDSGRHEQNKRQDWKERIAQNEWMNGLEWQQKGENGMAGIRHMNKQVRDWKEWMEWLEKMCK